LDFNFISGVFANPWDIIRSLIDITIVAWLFYRLLGVIKGTRAEQLLKGVIFLLVFSLLALLLKLEMVNWLIAKLWLAIAIALPIVFQPELRRFLEQLGSRSLFSARSSVIEEKYNLYREISNAAAILSRNRVGALIVLPRSSDIEEYLDSGIRLDALVSSAILINIFVPNTPLHDGAVIIQQGRIDRAGCFLPLSGNPMVDKELGTRHRAGLGISEVSDAAAVIVSEETGNISLAVAGHLNRYLDEESLRQMLAGLFENHQPADLFKGVR
jgi:diadenylate cyclase